VTPPIVLGPTISLFGGFGGNAGITNQGLNTVVNGDIGTTAASTLITGFYDKSVAAVAGVYPCSYTITPLNVGLVNGSIDTAPPPPTGACSSEGTAVTMATATEALLEAQTAYTTLKNLPPGTVLPSNELGNLTLAPGTYTSASFYDITAGPLTLNAQGNPNAVWIFQMGTYLTVGSPSASASIVLTGGAQAKNVFWQVATSGTLGTNSIFQGNILSLQSITLDTGATLIGRALARNGAVTLESNTLTAP